MIDFRSAREKSASAFDYIQVRIASPEEIRGPRDPKERERLEMPTEVKEQLTTMDSLRCCTRTGLLGFEHVHRVEPVLMPEVQR